MLCVCFLFALPALLVVGVGLQKHVQISFSVQDLRTALQIVDTLPNLVFHTSQVFFISTPHVITSKKKKKRCCTSLGCQNLQLVIASKLNLHISTAFRILHMISVQGSWLSPSPASLDQRERLRCRPFPLPCASYRGIRLLPHESEQALSVSTAACQKGVRGSSCKSIGRTTLSETWCFLCCRCPHLQ